jgi:hypothetical protein
MVEAQRIRRTIHLEFAFDRLLAAKLEQGGALDGIAILHWTDAKMPVGIHTHMAPSVRMEATPL